MSEETILVIRHLSKEDVQPIEDAIDACQKQEYAEYACIHVYSNDNRSLKTIEID
jgi:hypothetical protein